MSIKAIIVDDDPKSRELIHIFCKSYSDNKIHVLDLCHSVDSAILSIEKHQPDLVFLDIDMPKKNGFELLNHFTRVPFEIVFVTGHDNQYTRALEISALNYLMKPINPLNIKSIIDHFEKKKALDTSVNQIAILKNNLRNEKTTLVIPDKDGFKVLTVNDIISCETGNGSGKCKIETTKGNIVISKPMNKMIQLLPSSIFLSVSSSAIINKKMVESFNGKEFNLKMNNGRIIKVSERFFNKKELIDALSN
ncbi:LytR/AlgR family response regulator transcription factor [Flavobacterium sp. TSSA_36]|uniref:LytR/AlgR family response regulator transcription factor n=1 Tax=Flavobacterium sp. TSSA_36 TaxID=3447669 RepID=UPI003F2E4DCE